MTSVRPFLTLTVLAGVVGLTACPARVDGQSVDGQSPAARNHTVHAPGPVTGTAAGRAGSCAEAALVLDPASTVAVVNGREVKAGELGEELVRREEQLLRTYCQEVATAREVALDNLLSEAVLDAEAKKAGGSPETVLRAHVERVTGEPPSEAAVQKFYDERSRPGVPPLDEVRPQVIAAMQRERAEEAVGTLLEELKGKAEIRRQLPDVRPPPLPVDLAPHTAQVGAADAKVTVVEFADFECPYCSRAADTMNALKEKYAGKSVRFAYRHFPLSFHPNARAAAEFSQCAQHQGRFWAFHDVAYDNQRALSEQDLKAHAATAGLDIGALEACLESGKAAHEVDVDYQKGEQLGVEGTPTFYVNGRPLTGGPDVENLSRAIDEALAAGG